MKRYPEYKDSGVEWLGEVPAHWSIDRIKWSVKVSRAGIWGDEPQGNEDDIGCVRVADFDRARFVVAANDLTIRNIPQKDLDGRMLKRGNLLLEKSGGGEKQPVGAVVLYERDELAVCSNFIARLELTAQSCPSYWRYLHSAAYSTRITTRSINQTSGIQNLDQQRYFNEVAPFPSYDEQTTIAAFLDRETAKIDALIAEQERLIALLKEKRQAVISHAVTKGLDPNAPMKDSGVEWLGEVPAHWEVASLKRVCSLLKDGTHLPPPRVEQGVPLLSVRNVEDGQFALRDDDSMISEDAFAELCRSFVPQPADVLLAIVGATLGKTAIVPDNLGPFYIQRSLAVFRPGAFVSSSWLNLVFRSDGFQRLLWENVGYSAQPGIYLGTLAAFHIPVPSRDEQDSIVQWIGEQIDRLDLLIDEAALGIALLQERRSALISAAVTGKIDVRGLVQQTAEAA